YDTAYVVAGLMSLAGALCFDAEAVQFPRRNREESLGCRRKDEREWPRCRLAVVPTQEVPLFERLQRGDSLPQDGRQQFVVRGVGCGQVQGAERTQRRVDRTVMATNHRCVS
ncbi:MAG: hypothetical protein EBV88_07190, partial [Actinobacteria bacterium]|nr:hypothetical protein [Actinomycetota bacterium]